MHTSIQANFNKLAGIFGITVVYMFIEFTYLLQELFAKDE